MILVLKIEGLDNLSISGIRVLVASIFRYIVPFLAFNSSGVMFSKEHIIQDITTEYNTLYAVLGGGDFNSLIGQLG